MLSGKKGYDLVLAPQVSFGISSFQSATGQGVPRRSLLSAALVLLRLLA